MSDLGAATSTMRETRVSPRSVKLTEFAQKASGAWPHGWYSATVIDGFVKGGHEFLSGNTAAKQKRLPSGEMSDPSVNLMVCFTLNNAETKEARNDFAQFNYRTSDFDPETLEVVRNLRAEMKGVRGRWEGFEDEQRSSIAVAKLGQLFEAIGTDVPLSDDGEVIMAGLAGSSLFVRLGVDEETGYNTITGFSKWPTGVEPGKRKKKPGRV